MKRVLSQLIYLLGFKIGFVWSENFDGIVAYQKLNIFYSIDQKRKINKKYKLEYLPSSCCPGTAWSEACGPSFLAWSLSATRLLWAHCCTLKSPNSRWWARRGPCSVRSHSDSARVDSLRFGLSSFVRDLPANSPSSTRPQCQYTWGKTMQTNIFVLTKDKFKKFFK